MLTRFKTALVRPLHDGALRSGLSAWAAGRQPVRRIVMMHGVGPEDELSSQSLDELLRWLAPRFRIVSLASLVDGLRAGRNPDAEVALTFDDGLRCHFEHAYPVLVRHSAPATMFVCPGLIETGKWLWNHEARARLLSLEAAALADRVSAWGLISGDVVSIVGWMKTLRLPQRTAVENDIRRASPDFAPRPNESARFAPLSWSELDQLDRRLVTIGSHTLTHPILPTLDDASLESELRESRAWLERRLRRKVELFCYPNGSADARVRLAAERVYGAAVTTEYGNISGTPNLLRLPRVPVANRLSLMAWRLHRPLA